jgi:hypothetical protein
MEGKGGEWEGDATNKNNRNKAEVVGSASRVQGSAERSKRKQNGGFKAGRGKMQSDGLYAQSGRLSHDKSPFEITLGWKGQRVTQECSLEEK